MMLSIPKAFRRGMLGSGLFALSMAVPASSAQAMPALALVSPSIASHLAASMVLANQCYWFVHDRNGNRISYTSAPAGFGMNWGSSGFGCSKWGV